MNRNFKVVWNRSLGCFTAVAEYAKSRGKSSSSTVSSSSSASAAITTGARLLRLSSLTVALAATGLALSSQAFAAVGDNGGARSQASSTAISPTAAECGVLGQAAIVGNAATNSTAIGCGTTITNAPDSVAIGRENTVTATNNTQQQIGDRRLGGVRAYPTGETLYTGTAVAVGDSNAVGAGGGVALGNSNQVTGTFHGIAVGQGNVTSGGYALGLGVGNLSSGVASVAIGTANEATGNTSVAIGRQSYALADFSIATGGTATVEAGATNGIALGTSATVAAASIDGIAIGTDAQANSSKSVAIGEGSNASGASAYALGENANAAGQNTVALGADTSSNTQYGVSIGRAASSTGQSSVAIGGGTAGGGAATTNGNGAIAIGSGGNNALGAKATNTRAIAIGQASEATGASSISIGATANASIANSVALGAGSTTTAPAGNSFLTDVAAVPANGVVSVGTAAATRRIQNVAGGSAATDAVNVAQLTEQNTRTNRQGVDTAAALGGGSTYTANTGAVSLPTYNVGGATFNNVGTALGNIDGRTTTNTGNITNLQNQTFRLRANTDTATPVAASDTVTFLDGNNVNITRAGNNITIGTSATPTFTTVTSTGAMNAGSLTVTGASNLNGGADLNNNQITGVASAGDITELGNVNNAVNAGDLNTAVSGLTDLGFNIAADNGADDNVDLGDTVTFTNDDNNLMATVRDNEIVYDLADDITVDSLSADDGTGNATTINATGTTVTDGTNTSTYGANGLTIAGGPSITAAGIDAAGNTISNVADGINATDVASFGQLTDTNNIATGNLAALGAGAAYDPATDLYTPPSYVLDDGTNAGTSTTFNNVGDALGNLDTRTTTNTGDIANIQTQANQGFNISAAGGTDDNVQLGQTVDFTNTDGNLVVTNDVDNGINYDLADDITVDSLSADDGTGNATTINATGTTVTDGTNTSTYGANGFSATDGTTSTVFNQAGVTFLDNNNDPIGPSITAAGIDAGNTQITGVASAGDITELGNVNNAVNAGDLNTAVSGLTDLGFNIAADNGADDNVDLGDTVTFTNDDNNLMATVRDNEIVYDLADDITVDSLSADDGTGNATTINATGTTVTDGTNTSTYGANGLTIAGGPSITAAGIDAAGNTISNVADGINATDVASFGQLTDTNNIATGNLAALGAGAAYDPATDLYTPPSYVLDDGTNAGTSTTFNNVGDALGNLDTRTTTNTGDIANIQTQANQGFNISAAGGTDDNVQLGQTVDFTNTDGNLVVTNDVDNGINYDLADDITVDSLSADDGTGNATTINATGTTVTDGTNTSTYGANGFSATDGTTSTVFNQAGVTFLDNNNDPIGPSITAAGIDAGNTQITGVASAGDITELGNVNNAVNAGDLNTAVSGLTDLGFNIAADNGADDNVDLGDTVTFTNDDNNLMATVRDNEIVYDLADDITVDSLSADDGTGNATTINATGTTVTDGTNTSTYGANGLTIAGGPSITAAGIDAAGNTISNVADGINATDVASFGQLTDTNNIATGNLAALGAGAAYDPATDLYTPPSYVLDDGTNAGTSTTFNNVGDALGNLDTRTTTNTGDIANIQTQANQGFNISAAGGTDDNVQLGQTVDFTNTDGNLVVTNDVDNGINYDLADDITVDSLSADDGTGNATTINATGTTVTDGTNTSTYGANGFSATDGTTSTVFNQAGVTFLDNNNDPIGPSITAAGIDAGNTQITGVASAGDITELGNVNNAVNAGDLNTAVSGLTDLGFNIAADNGADDNVDLGDTVTFTNDDNNLMATVRDNEIVYDLADDITVDSLSADDGTGNATTINATGTTVTDGTNTSTYGANGLTIAGGPSITAAGIDAAGNTISNVADGINATDVASFGQLTDTNNIATGNLAALGAGAAYDPATDLYTPPSYVLDDGTNAGTSTTFNNVGDALGNLDTRTTTNTGDIANIQTQANQGFNISAAGGTDDNVQLGQTVDFTNTDGNLVVTNDVDNGINYDLADDITVDSLSADDGTGNATTINATGTTVTDGTNTSTYGANGFSATDGTTSTVFNQAGVTFLDNNNDPIGPSITAAGIDAGNTQITGVASAGDITELGNVNNAVNAGDLNTAVSGLTDLGFNIAADNGADDNVDLGDTVTFTNDDNNLMATVRDNEIVYDLADDITVDSLSADDGTGNATTINATGTTVTDGTNTSTYGANGLTIAGGPSITAAGIDAAGNTISNVADGINATDVASFGQLTDTNNIATGNLAALGAGAAYDPATDLYTPPSYVLDDGTNAGTSTTFNNVGDALGNLDTRTTTNTGDINDLAAGRTGIVRQDAGTGIITVGAQTGGDSVSFTGTDGNRTLSGLANGSVATGSDEAVTGDQLNTSAESLASVIGGNAVNNGGVVTTTDIGGTGADTIDGAISSLNTAVTQAKSTVTQGDNIVVATTTNADGSTNYEVATARDLDIDSVVTGDSTLDNTGLTVDDGTNASTYGANGLTIAGGPSITAAGIDIAGNQLTNLQSGLNGDTLANATGNTLTNAANIGDLQNVVANVTNLGFGLSADNGDNDNVNLGQTVNFTNTDGNLVATVSDNGINYDLAENIDLGDNGSVTTGNTVVSNAGVAVDDGAGNATTITTAGTSISDDAGNSNIVNATGNTLDDGAGNVTTLNSAGTVVSNGTSTTSYDANGITITDSQGTVSIISAGGINAGGQVVTGVADGIEVNDAVNVGQLNNFGNQINGAINDLGYRINEVEDDANAGISAAMAMSSLPQAYIPGKSMVGGGIASYNGQSAVAIGLSRVSDNGRWVIKANGTADSEGNAGGAVGAGFHF